MVLDSQIAAIDAVRIGNSYKEPHNVAVRILVQGLLDLGIMQGDIDEIIAKRSLPSVLYAWYGSLAWVWMCMMSVHTSKMVNGVRYEEGMVVTVEPGLYIAPDDESVDEKWRGIGIRIEDDVVVTQSRSTCFNSCSGEVG